MASEVVWIQNVTEIEELALLKAGKKKQKSLVFHYHNASSQSTITSFANCSCC